MVSSSGLSLTQTTMKILLLWLCCCLPWAQLECLQRHSCFQLMRLLKRRIRWSFVFVSADVPMSRSNDKSVRFWAEPDEDEKDFSPDTSRVDCCREELTDLIRRTPPVAATAAAPNCWCAWSIGATCRLLRRASLYGTYHARSRWPPTSTTHTRARAARRVRSGLLHYSRAALASTGPTPYAGDGRRDPLS